MKTPLRLAHVRLATALALDAHPWRQWLVFYCMLLSFFSVYRCVGLSAMLDNFATPDERTAATTVSAIVLGICEDFVLITLLLVLLSLVDVEVGPRSGWAVWTVRQRSNFHFKKTEDEAETGEVVASTNQPHRCNCGLVGLSVALRRLVRFVLHTALIILAIVPFAVDILLLRIRGMRFTFEFVNMYLREINFTSGFTVDPNEVTLAKQTVAVSLTVAAFLVLVSLIWFDFARCHLAMLFEHRWSSQRADHLTVATAKLAGGSTFASLENGVRPSYERVPSLDPELISSVPIQEETKKPTTMRAKWHRAGCIAGLSLVVCTALCTALLLITHAMPAVVSATALNNSLNELFRTTTKLQFLKSLGDGTIESASVYLDPTETYELFQDDVLYRKTTGFTGPLAFDVAVNASNPPNVLVIAVESFRYQDSLYIVGNKSEALRNKLKNVTLTPNFDRWAQRGIAFRNFWSSWQTSRSLESILFGQVPYDHIVDTGTSGGRKGVQLSGMPQLFKAKGYETVFTTGAKITYDQWDKFLPSHGFEEVVSYKEFRRFAIETKNMTNQYEQDNHFEWGLHDDMSLEILGDLLFNKTQQQHQRVASGDAKRPFFLNHYTVSSHTPFSQLPEWFRNKPLPQLEPFYKGLKNEADVRRYAHARYFTDNELGKFFARMDHNGVLQDTIVVIVGDHGQSPEQSLAKPDVDQVATTRVAAALIAEGRLGKYAGMVVDSAAEHVDLLNTLADIAGVPDEGYLQSGVGRSLKRAFPDAERPVWSNNPKITLAVVKGHRRLKFDRVFSMMQLFNAEADPDQTTDLLPTLSESERNEWETLRERGRRVSRYFKVRWDNECISQITC